MEDIFFYVRKTKPVLGWICGGLSFAIPVLAIASGAQPLIGPALVMGGILGIYTNVIGAAHNSKGQVCLGIAGIIFALTLSTIPSTIQKQEATPITTSTLTSNTVQNTPPANTPTSGTPSLSADKKSIVLDDKVLLAVDSDIIFNWFKTASQLCAGNNLTSTPDRKIFCENKTSFKSKTRFASIVVSPDKMKIGFTIESDALSPDKVTGVFLRSTNQVNLLTNYYLGNEFISFSPSGINFVYQGGCFEGRCGLFIKNSETLAIKASLNNPEFADTRGQNATFVRWISDNQVEYKLGTELKRESF